MERNLKTWNMEVKDEGQRISLSYTGSVVLMPLLYLTLLEKNYSKIEKSNRENENLLREVHKFMKNLPHLEQKLYENGFTDGQSDWISKHKGINNKKSCGTKADAEILALAIQGKSMDEICQTRLTYNKQGQKKLYRKDKIYRALRLTDDVERRKQLFMRYPDVFDGINMENLMNWCRKKPKRTRRRK